MLPMLRPAVLRQSMRTRKSRVIGLIVGVRPRNVGANKKGLLSRHLLEMHGIFDLAPGRARCVWRSSHAWPNRVATRPRARTNDEFSGSAVMTDKVLTLFVGDLSV